MFHALKITDARLLDYHIQRVTDYEARNDFGIRGSKAKKMDGLAYPYLHPQTGCRVTVRVRLDEPETDQNGKAKNKYVSAWGDRRHLYFPPDALARLEDSEAEVVLVEAEKSVLALDCWAERSERKIIPAGTGGCWGFLGRIGIKSNSQGERVSVNGPLPDLDYLNGRRVYVCLDANAETNPQVRKASNALVRELKRRDSEVLICHLPQTAGVNGPDDLIAVGGDGAMDEVLAQATPGRLTHDYGGGRFEVSEDRGVEYHPPPDKDGKSTSLWLASTLHIRSQDPGRQ
jgi:hypothetical protein